MGLGLLTSWTAACPLFLSPQGLACASQPGWGHMAHRVTTETPGPIACKSGPRTWIQQQHSDCLGYAGTVRASGSESIRAMHCQEGGPCHTTLPPIAATGEEANSTELITGPVASGHPLPFLGFGFLCLLSGGIPNLFSLLQGVESMKWGASPTRGRFSPAFELFSGQTWMWKKDKVGKFKSYPRTGRDEMPPPGRSSH